MQRSKKLTKHNLTEEIQFFNKIYISLLSAPIKISYTTKQTEFVFKEGNFFSVAPGFYKQNEFGIRLRNVFEVVDTGDKHFSGAKFLAFKVATLVPFDTKLIDRTLLSTQEVRNYTTIDDACD
jgi:Xaa-Pro aminopeptidase